MNIKTKASRVHVFIIQIARGLSKDQDIFRSGKVASSILSSRGLLSTIYSL